MITFDNFLTETFNHYRTYGNNTYDTFVGSGLCSPADALSDNSMMEAYPNNKQFSFRQIFTSYTSFLSGDTITVDNIDYTIRVVNSYAEQMPMEFFVHLIVEQEYGS